MNPPAADGVRACPHCGDLLSDRQISRHLARRRRQLGEEVDGLLQRDYDVHPGVPNLIPDGVNHPLNENEPAAGEHAGNGAIGMEGVEEYNAGPGKYQRLALS